MLGGIQASWGGERATSMTFARIRKFEVAEDGKYVWYFTHVSLLTI